jgi:spore coat polysaccharide biosynthesis protein SpsF
MSIVCIIQARMGSERLPGKVLQSIEGKPMIERVIERVERSHLVDGIVIATTTLPQDDVLAELCATMGWNCYRGSEQDVLDRYYRAAQHYGADYIVRVTSDCPLVDPTVLDYVTAAFVSSAPAVDYASNTITRTYPRGLDIEIFSFAALELAWNDDKAANWREHVTPYIHQQADKFRLLIVTNPVDFSHYRWTVDTPQDLDLVRRIYSHFGHTDFGWRDVLAAFAEYPEWESINRDITQKSL